MKKMKTKMIGTLAIAGLIAMAVFVGTAAANGVAHIYGSRSYGDSFEQRHNFITTNDLFGWGYFGFCSEPGYHCPEGCGGRIYVVEHKETWTNGDPLNDESGGNVTLPWCNTFFEMAWPTPLEPGKYDLILDLNVTGTENYYVWTNITNELGYGPDYLTDPIWTIYVTGDDPEPIPEFSTMVIPVAAIRGLLFFYNYRKRRREG